MQLTKKERWILINQYRILMALSLKEDKDEFAKACEILERGYELHYPYICNHIVDDNDVLDEESCKEVIEILTMFDTIKFSYNSLQEKADIDESKIEFPGFDGNNESDQASYARFLCIKDNGFSELINRINVNSHIPMLPKYRKMLTRWAEVKDYKLTKDNIIYMVS